MPCSLPQCRLGNRWYTACSGRIALRDWLNCLKVGPTLCLSRRWTLSWIIFLFSSCCLSSTPFLLKESFSEHLKIQYHNAPCFCGAQRIALNLFSSYMFSVANSMPWAKATIQSFFLLNNFQGEKYDELCIRFHQLWSSCLSLSSAVLWFI